MRNGSKTGSEGSFSVNHNELIISGAGTVGNGGISTILLGQAGRHDVAFYEFNNYHFDGRGNLITTSLSSSGTESQDQTFTGKRISSASSAYVFICSSFANESPPASLGSICLSVSLSALSKWSQNPATIILTSAAALVLRFFPPAGPRLSIRPLQVRASAPNNIGSASWKLLTANRTRLIRICLDVCVCVSGMHAYFVNIHLVGGSVVDKNNLLYVPNSPVFTGGEQHDVAAGVSFGSSMCAQHQHQL
eukprot:SAG31_NODE_284_length_18497_cov_11.811773_18_plen_249_part_00